MPGDPPRLKLLTVPWADGAFSISHLTQSAEIPAGAHTHRKHASRYEMVRIFRSDISGIQAKTAAANTRPLMAPRFGAR